jgi:hypothetical protein
MWGTPQAGFPVTIPKIKSRSPSRSFVSRSVDGALGHHAPTESQLSSMLPTTVSGRAMIEKLLPIGPNLANGDPEQFVLLLLIEWFQLDDGGTVFVRRPEGHYRLGIVEGDSP